VPAWTTVPRGACHRTTPPHPPPPPRWRCCAPTGGRFPTTCCREWAGLLPPFLRLIHRHWADALVCAARRADHHTRRRWCRWLPIYPSVRGHERLAELRLPAVPPTGRSLVTDYDCGFTWFWAWHHHSPWRGQAAYYHLVADRWTRLVGRHTAHIRPDNSRTVSGGPLTRVTPGRTVTCAGKRSQATFHRTFQP